MINKLILPSSALISLLLLSSCGDTNTPSVNESPTATTTPVTQTTTPATTTPITQTTTPATGTKTSQLSPGTYCYSAKTKTLDANAKINISSNNQINGQIQATIQNPAESYYTSYNQTLTGELTKATAKLNIVTKIEDDTQNSQENWTITASELKTGRETFVKADCATLKANQNPEEQTPVNSKIVRVNFPKGANSTTIKNSVIRSDRDTYILGAKQGQTMNLKISSLENNAVFEVIAPNGQTLIPEATTWNGKLPVNGDYQVIVGGTRGNASYELAVEIN